MFICGALTSFILLFLHLSNSTESHSTTKGKTLGDKGISLRGNNTLATKTLLMKDDTVYDVLKNKNIASGEIFGLLAASKKIHSLAKIRPGNTLELEISPDNKSIMSLKYNISQDKIMVLERSANGFSARQESIRYDTEIFTKSVIISHSLYEAVVDSGLASHIALDLTDIFAWQIDFPMDIRRGDSFTIVLERKLKEGNFVGNGRILCAEFANQGQKFQAFRFKDKDGHIDYYDAQGNSVQKQFLNSPLRYKYISSGYSKRRLHPILKINRPHLGIDYAAPIGTPVSSVGDGKVVFAGRNGGYGMFLKIRHNGVYTSTYGHLSRFAKGIKRNKYVKQGQLIGYVGSTGLSTGPHLDYRLIKNSKFINPLTCSLPSANAVGKEYMKDFELVRKEMIPKLKDLDPNVTASGDRTFIIN